MKITKAQLKQIIKEELGRAINEIGEYERTGAYPEYPLFAKIEVNGVRVGAILNAGRRPDYAIPPINPRGEKAMEGFRKLRDAVHQDVEQGKYEGYSQVLIDPLPRNFGNLMLTTVDGKTEYKKIPKPQGI